MQVSVYRYVPSQDVTPRMQEYEIDIPAEHAGHFPPQQNILHKFDKGGMDLPEIF